MSIIEKAAGRIAHSAKETRSTIKPMPPAPTPAPVVVALQDAVTRSVEPEAPARAAPAVIRLNIDLERLQKAGMVTPNGERTPVAEEFRFIKRPLIGKALQKGEGSIRNGNLIMVTSSLPGEGKTFCAINLAMSIAMEMDHTVLLVDADVARPSVLSTLGLHAEAGLMDLLRDDSLDMSDVMIKTNVQTLSILPAGNSQKNATELLASHSMKKLLDEIASRYPDRIVIFDSPPLLLTSEARVLAEQMGQIVMVVEAEKTTQNAVKDALRRIEACANINLVYNKGRTFVEPSSYGYYSRT
ncbi:MAG TPA: XrtA-associated tyrosine autokinase [Noviherbaspirillum sp.]|nr:XrtA-associated tyrosine autokinase [Noviherbaspirillum sp.]